MHHYISKCVKIENNRLENKAVLRWKLYLQFMHTSCTFTDIIILCRDSDARFESLRIKFEVLLIKC